MAPSSLSRAAFVVLALFALTPWASSALALGLGLALALTVGNPFADATKRWTSPLLQAAVVALGGAMDLLVVLRVGANGVGYTAIGIVFTLALGALLARLLDTDRTTGLLVSVGTAICGGSAIAAVAPAIRAKGHQVSVSLGVVFLLNALALVVFPRIGHALDLSQSQFGLWAALAIHDTSSVVGASLQFGHEALDVGTTVKLARALWIIPVTLVAARLHAGKDADPSAPPANRPWFILGFILVAAAATFVPGLREPGQLVADAGRRVLVLTLFLVGASITRESLRAVGARPLVLGVTLWVVVAGLSLAAIATGLVGV